VKSTASENPKVKANAQDSAKVKASNSESDNKVKASVEKSNKVSADNNSNKVTVKTSSSKVQAGGHKRTGGKVRSSAKVTKLAGNDLRHIRGIGSVMAQKLIDAGVKNLDDLIALTPAQMKQVGAAIAFAGRMESEDWVGQAKAKLGK